MLFVDPVAKRQHQAMCAVIFQAFNVNPVFGWFARYCTPFNLLPQVWVVTLRPLMVGGFEYHALWLTDLDESFGKSVCFFATFPQACSRMILRISCHTSQDDTHVTSRTTRVAIARSYKRGHAVPKTGLVLHQLIAVIQLAGFTFLIFLTSLQPFSCCNRFSISMYQTSQLLSFISRNWRPRDRTNAQT